MADGREVTKEFGEAISAWRDVRRTVKKVSKDGITPAERAELKKEIIEAVEETAEALGVAATYGRDALKELREFLEQRL